MTSAEIRQQFLDFSGQRTRHCSFCPIVVKNDPTLLFTNAGMNQFKDYFGNKQAPDARVADTKMFAGAGKQRPGRSGRRYLSSYHV